MRINSGIAMHLVEGPPEHEVNFRSVPTDLLLELISVRRPTHVPGSSLLAEKMPHRTILTSSSFPLAIKQMGSLHIDVLKPGGAIVRLDLSQEEAVREVLQVLSKDGFIVLKQATDVSREGGTLFDKVLSNKVSLLSDHFKPQLRVSVCSGHPRLGGKVRTQRVRTLRAKSIYEEIRTRPSLETNGNKF